MTFVIELESMNENGIELGIRNQAITPDTFQSQEQTTPSTNGIEQICNNGHTHMGNYVQRGHK